MHFPVVWLIEKNQTTAKCKSPFWTTGKYINACTSRWFQYQIKPQAVPSD